MLKLKNQYLEVTLLVPLGVARYSMKIQIVFVALVLAVTACSKNTAPPAKTERPVVTQVVGGHASEDTHVYSGEIRARHEVALGFRVGGKISHRLVDTGEAVKAGQVLMRLDSTNEGLQASSADAQYQSVKDEVERYRVLRSKNFISQSALDAKEATLKSMSAQAGLANNQSSYTVLVAEKSGVVTATLAEVGQVVTAGQTVIKFAQQGEREVAFSIPESQLAGLKIGMKAQVSLWSEGSERYHQAGRLRELSPAADAASRTYAARVTLPDSTVPIGMSAQVRFIFRRNRGGELLVPLSSIFQQGDKSAVWIVAPDHSVSLRAVQVSSYRDNGAVIDSGISAGERIVSAGVHKLHAGEKIRAVEDGRN